MVMSVIWLDVEIVSNSKVVVSVTTTLDELYLCLSHNLLLFTCVL